MGGATRECHKTRISCFYANLARKHSIWHVLLLWISVYTFYSNRYLKKTMEERVVCGWLEVKFVTASPILMAFFPVSNRMLDNIHNTSVTHLVCVHWMRHYIAEQTWSTWGLRERKKNNCWGKWIIIIIIIECGLQVVCHTISQKLFSPHCCEAILESPYPQEPRSNYSEGAQTIWQSLRQIREPANETNYTTRVLLDGNNTFGWHIIDLMPSAVSTWIAKNIIRPKVKDKKPLVICSAQLLCRH